MAGAKAKAGAAARKDGPKVAGKRKPGGDKVKRAKAIKDPNKPKRPPTAFFIFMEEFRKTFKEKHPDNKKVSVVSKACGDEWKSMSDAKKAPYQEAAAKRKAEYEKSMAAYNNKESENENASVEEEVGCDHYESDKENEDENGEQCENKRMKNV